MRISLIGILVVVSCSGGKPSVEDEPIAVATDEKSDLWKTTLFLGDYEVGGDRVKGVVYHDPPKYRSFSFHAPAGTTVDIRVSSDGDAVAWLFDDEGKRLGYIDDADGGTDAHIHVKLKPSNGYYYVYFRDYYLDDATFGFGVAAVPEPGSIGDAERAYDAAAAGDRGLDPYWVAARNVPQAVQRAIDADVKSWSRGSVDEYALPSGRDLLYVARGSVEEYAWLDIFDASGQFIVHGECGDGDLEVTAWGGVRGPHY